MSFIVKYIYNHASEEVVRRGKKIFLTQGVTMQKKDELTQQLHFKVRNDQYYNHYNVTISKYQSEDTIKARCTCPYNMGEICRHEAAALFHLNELIINQKLDTNEVHFKQTHTVIRMTSIELKSLRLYTSNSLFEESEQIAKRQIVKILKADNEHVVASMEEEGNSFDIKLKRNDDKTFDTYCNCDETKHPLCKHKTALFLQILNANGENYFDSIRNWDSQKNKLLGLYGYSLEDDLSGKFEFYYVDEKPFLKVLDPSIKKVSANETRPSTIKINTQIDVESKVIDASKFPRRIGLVLNLNEPTYPYFTCELIEGEIADYHTGFVGTVQKIDLSRYVVLDNFHEADRPLIALGRKLHKVELNKYIAKYSPFGDMWINVKNEQEDLSIESKEAIHEYMHLKLQKILYATSAENPIYVIPKGKAFKTSSLQRVSFLHHNLYPSFSITKEKDEIKVAHNFLFDDERINLSQNELNNHLLFLHNSRLILINKHQDANHSLNLNFKSKISLAEWPQFLKSHIIPISKKYEIQFEDGLVSHESDVMPDKFIMLTEVGQYFVVKPFFRYLGHDVEWNEEHYITHEQEGRVIYLKRNKEEENAFAYWVQSFHAQMKKPEYENHFALHAKYAFQNNWFFYFFEQLKEFNIEVFGYEKLNQFRVNKSKPTTSVYVSSNLDWFDTEIILEYNGVQASMREIQKAINSKQNVVKLSDGTLGLLPDEWMKQFSLLFKMADIQGNSLKVSKYNFTIIDELYDLIHEEDVRSELELKREALLNTDWQQNAIPVPYNVKALLRPYQEAGFSWLVYLNKINWGGLLADDMGLGKTLQTLTFLQYLKNENGSLKALVVCPTTLLFNWENEIKKFTPDISYVIHHGANRTASTAHLLEHNIILTTYGTLRSDAEMFSKHMLDYIVIDESQTIKNPNSKVAKSTQIVNAKNRIALSGTPMQNNTFDLYSQMNFLNPGMLGNKEFFKEQFAKPIDKFQEAESKDHLRRLVYPFMLRRTKEQVAADLPEKTEITLFCEMEKEQRAVYDLYKNMYRSQILNTIEAQGVERSQFAILQGLMKLRQICDSPAILKGDTKYENHSVKLDELVREIEENIGNHKALVFSQFLGMLGLIKERLTERGISFQYFDGSYTAIQREKAIKDFQENDDCRVFLISLKAGGMGLNLTAADYVYIVDPWWNPAVEQQAIDRTHRIGQTKNIFAYRMICKDTIEEKIQLLKEKKNTLVKDIISDDTSIAKQLTKEDIQYLFS